MNGPLVSVLMNCYNGERYLCEALASVLHQTHENWEIIFWDNLSRDSSADIVHSFKDSRINYFSADKHTNLGQARAHAWGKTTGEFVAVLDVDDIWLPEKLEKQLPLFDDPSVGIVISDTYFFSSDRKRRLYGKKMPPTGHVFDELLKNYYVSLETLVLRKSTVDGLGYSFDPSFSHIADFDLVLRASAVSQLALFPEVLAGWRIHDGNESSLRPEKFITEKHAFVRKLDSINVTVDGNYRKARQVFVESIFRSEAIQLLVIGERHKARNVLIKKLSFNWKTWALIIASLLPLPRVAISRLKDRWH